MGAEASPERLYRPELDRLRFVAFLAVFLDHSLPQVPFKAVTRWLPELAEWMAAAARAGGTGVDLFFVLSGYLITELLVRERTLTGSVDIGSFYIRRALRIWPLCYAVLATTLLLVPHLLPHEHLTRRYAIAFGIFGANWACAWWGWPLSSIGPLWSVSVEEQFYLAWPLIVYLVPRERLPWVGMGMILTAWLTRFVLMRDGTSDIGVACNTFARLDTLAGGILTALILNGTTPRLRRSRRILLGGAGAFCILAFSRYTGLKLTRWDLVLASPANTVGCVAILIATLRNGPRLPAVGRQPWVYLGRISYGLYVFHRFALHLVAAFLTGVPPVPALFGALCLGFFLTVALGIISFQFLEKPFLHLKQRFTLVASRPGG